ncbi:hypothetical protein AB0J72_14180 [Dactylosporangium sp. NPDC049742]|uniref:hypothetical protein n=1 Tax=Dactylosporangium sp. NPDC049742 TaxID=3154737 RepID=UPI003428BA1C
MVVPESGHGWHLPDGPPPGDPDERGAPADEFPTPPVYWPPPQPAPAPSSAQGARRPAVIALVLAGLVSLVACVCVSAYLNDKPELPRSTAPTYSRPAAPAAPSLSSRPPSSAPAGPPRVWALKAPARAGTMRRSDDPPPVPDPYSATYEDPLDPQYMVMLTGQVGARFTQDGPQAAVDAWLAAQDPARAQTTLWAEEMVWRGPLTIGGVALCRDSVGLPTPEAWCAWASDGVVVEFVFVRVPAPVAWDRMAEMLPAIATYS